MEQTVCLGYSRREILPPYPDREIAVEMRRLRRIAEEEEVIRMGTAVDFVRWYDNNVYDRYDQGDMLRLIGVWTDSCIAAATSYALSHGTPCSIDLDKTSVEGRCTNEEKAQALKDQVRRLCRRAYNVMETEENVTFCHL